MSLKQLVNDLLRLGLQRLREGGSQVDRPPARTASVELGKCFVELDDVAEALAIAEDDRFK